MRTRRPVVTLWVVCICLLAVLHFVHLQADFPNYSRWMDWSKYTDEGGYANAAIQHFLRGHWYVPGDLNTVAAVPVWPVILWMLFHFTGVSMLAARALVGVLFCCNLGLSYLFIRKEQPQWTALLTCSLIATSSFLWCFSRLAILEPLLICLTLMALLVGRRIGELDASKKRRSAAVVLGVLLCLMILTKTTAVFLIPAVLYSTWHPLRTRPRAALTCLGISGVVAVSLWLLYFFAWVHPHLLADYQYFFKMNVYAKPHRWRGWLRVVGNVLRATFWIGRPLVWAFIILGLSTIVLARRTWTSPAFGSSCVAIGGYLLFIIHINNAQPRYYAVIAFFLIFATSIALRELVQVRKLLGIALLVLCMIGMGKGLWEIGGYILYPEYTFVNAAKGIVSYVDRHPNGNRLVVSVSGNDLSLMTGLPSVCDEFGTMPLREKIALYKPGWYAAWDDLDPALLADLRSQYSVEAVAAFNAFDDDDRDTLVLYKLMPARPGTSYYKNEIYHQMP
jgi:hypothetical protein